MGERRDGEQQDPAEDVGLPSATFLLDDGETTVAVDALSADQLNGISCIWCDRQGGHMMPVGHGPGGQVFEHTPSCPEGRS